MQPQRVMRHLNVNPHFKTHADNIAQIIACADCIAEADLRVGYYMMVVGVNHDKVPVEEAPPRREFKMENLRVSMPAADFSRIMDAPPHVPVDIPQPGEAGRQDRGREGLPRRPGPGSGRRCLRGRSAGRARPSSSRDPS